MENMTRVFLVETWYAHDGVLLCQPQKSESMVGIVTLDAVSISNKTSRHWTRKLSNTKTKDN